jgi:hypothetical protein
MDKIEQELRTNHGIAMAEEIKARTALNQYLKLRRKESMKDIMDNQDTSWFQRFLLKMLKI